MKNKIHDVADSKGISIVWLSKTSGIGRSHLYRIMNDEANPSMKTAKRIADTLGTNISKLFPNS